jgi:hydrogenase maturation factor
MFGPLAGKHVTSAASAKPGDVIVMTKTAALEATAIIARERENTLKKAGFSPIKIRKMKNLLFQPGISILPEAQVALSAGCSAMHDATEGGILTALWEIASASKVQIEAQVDAIPLLPETVDACRIWKLNPLRTISSGTLLITISQKKLSRLLKNLSAIGIQSTVIGKIHSGPADVIDKATQKCILPSEDEIVKIYS